jgi:NAD(P)-dependent dehydrogenase (short-subunit alcohol dehydrogenase family)
MDTPDLLSMQMWDRITDCHLRGTYRMTVEVGTRMTARGAGAIVTVASVVGIASGPLHAYGPAKAALINLCRGLAVEWGRQGVRVNTVSPGFVRTPGTERGFEAKLMDPAQLAEYSALGRVLEPDEVAAAIQFLTSELASGITGCDLPVDAGYLAASPWAVYGDRRPG